MNNQNQILTLKEAYETMLHMLNNYYGLTGSTDLTDILSGGEYLTDDKPADSAFWDYWLEAYSKLKSEGPIRKELI